METLWLALAAVFAIIGLLGAVLPVLPGSPLSYAALWMMWLRNSENVSSTSLWIAGLAMAIVTILDYVAPIWLTKHGGGTKYGQWGATIGLIVGLFAGPLGIIIGPFLGAFIGEKISETPNEKALKIAFMSLIAFFLTTGLKLIYAIGIIVWCIKVY